MYVNDSNLTHLDSFGVRHFTKEIKKLMGDKIIKTNIYKIQAYNSTICGYFCFGFIDFMLKVKVYGSRQIHFLPTIMKK